MADSNLNIIIKLVDKASAGAKNLVKNLKETEGAAKKSKTATEKLGEATKKAASDAGGLNSAMGLLKGALAGVGISMVIDKLIELGSEAINVASEVDEMRNKFDVVFGDSARTAESNLAEFGDEVGRSKYSLMEMAASLQDTFVPLGFARDKASELSVTMAQLAIDIASFNNASDADVMRDFQSAIVGNHETVRKYGIVISQATLNQELLTMGVKDGIKSATEEEKALARLNIIASGTSDAHGDAKRTADSYANASRALGDAIKDLNVEMAQGYMPTVEKTTKKTTEFVKALTAHQKLTNLIAEAQEKEAISTLKAGEIRFRRMMGVLDEVEATEELIEALERLAMIENGNMGNLSAEAAEAWGNRYREQVVAVEDLAIEYELQAEQELKLKDTTELLRAAQEAKLITDVRAEAAIFALKNGVYLLDDAELQNLATALAYHEAAQKTAERTKESGEKARDAAIHFFDLAESLKNASAADFASALLDELKTNIKSSGDAADGAALSTQDYIAAYYSINDAFNLVSPKQLEQSNNILEIYRLTQLGAMSTENWGEISRYVADNGMDYLALSQMGLLDTFGKSPAVLGDAELSALSYMDALDPLGALVRTLNEEQSILGDETIPNSESAFIQFDELGVSPIAESMGEASSETGSFKDGLGDIENTMTILKDTTIPGTNEQFDLLLADGVKPLHEEMARSVKEGGALYNFRQELIRLGKQTDENKKKLEDLKKAIEDLPERTDIWVYVHVEEVGGSSHVNFNRDAGHAHGNADYIVPPGYPNDSYNVGLTSGERVIVQTPAQQKSYHVTNNFKGGSEADIIGAMKRIEFLYG